MARAGEAEPSRQIPEIQGCRWGRKSQRLRTEQSSGWGAISKKGKAEEEEGMVNSEGPESVGALVPCGCCKKVLQTRWCSQSWRPGASDGGISRALPLEAPRRHPTVSPHPVAPGSPWLHCITLISASVCMWHLPLSVSVTPSLFL